MKSLFVCFLLVFSVLAHAQNVKIDSLQRELAKSKEDTVTFLCLSNLAWEYEALGEMEKAFIYAKKSLNILITKKIPDTKYKGEGNYLLAVLYFDVHQLDSALFCAKKALSDFEKMDIKNFNKLRNIALAKSYNLLSSLYGFYNNQTMALYYLEKAYLLNQDEKNYASMARNLNNMSINYKFKGQYSIAIEKAKSALKLTYEYKIPQMEHKIYLNMGNIYFDWKEYHKAIICFYKIIELAKKANDKKR